LTAGERSIARLAGVFGIVAVALAATGLFGVLSYGVTRRSREIGIRIALGARSRGVIGMILRESLAIVVAGLAAGCALAYLGSRLIATRLYGVAPRDPLTFLSAFGVLLAVALIAGYLPARRASRVDPTIVLYQE
jgi:putative ABC transport system permease protein